MYIIPGNGLALIEEDQAEDEVAAIYGEMKRQMQMPFIPNMMKAMAVSPAALKIHWEMFKAFYGHTTLPPSLVAMILFTIADRSDCEYCAIGNELTCRTLGIDEDTLAGLAEDLGSVNPERVRAVIEFALAVAKHPKELTRADFDAVRSYGISDEELVEIIQVAGIAVYSDILADSLKIDVDEMTAEALAMHKGG
jgi:uncharacterized peroxidase-related enzyme